MSRLRIFGKLSLALSLAGIATLMVSGWSSYRVARASLEKEAFEKLTAVREMKAQQLEDYFLQIQNQAISLSQDPIVVEMARDLPLAVEELNSGPTPDLQEAEARSERLREHYKRVILPRIGGARTSEPKLDEIFPTEGALRLQDLYIASNRHQTGEKHLLDTAGDGSSYSTLHARVHPTLRDYLERFGYYDIFIIEPTDGRIVYSVFKEIDFGTSLNNGPHRDSNLALAFRSAVAADAASFTKLVDYAPYEPSYDAPAAFIASPIFDGANLVGVLALQLPIDRINDVMTSHRRWSEVGLGSSGETYLVGSDYKLRNQSRFLIEDKDNYLTLISQTGMPEIDVSKIRKFGTSIGLQKVETAGTKAALQGERGTATFLDYRGVPVLSAYKPLEIGGLRWAIMSEIDEAEALAPASLLLRRVAMVSLAIAGLLILVSGLLSRSFTRPLRKLVTDAQPRRRQSRLIHSPRAWRRNWRSRSKPRVHARRDAKAHW